MAPILEAALLLADAHVEVIAWNGTSSGWLGFDLDLTLCQRIEQETGVRRCTSVRALNEIMEKTQRFRVRGRATPEPERELRLFRGHAAADHGDGARGGQRRPPVPHHLCTNLRAAHLAPALEMELGIPVYDTVSTAV